ncbi:methyltransferases [Striga hermonthica]|uniref:16S rRNA (uracil(1498)-N(3))-methyltransferase n=1 Tax=Striga hermonthica TaxID=68872 RepID=A0A9N7R288_STRHE|nr:methyltransferases [Striga hermonthica]
MVKTSGCWSEGGPLGQGVGSAGFGYRHKSTAVSGFVPLSAGVVHLEEGWGPLISDIARHRSNPVSCYFSKSVVELFNGKGGLVEGRIEKIDVAGVDLEATENPKLVSPQATQWHIFAAFSTLKGGRADWLVEKCTELGASSVTPLLTERSNSISENRVDRLQRLILAATKQCRKRLHEMILKPPITVVNLLPIVSQSRLSLVAVAEATPVLNTLRVLNKESAGIVIIGPEGDFTDKELVSLTEAGATAVGLGPHRLRVETATIALLSTLMLWSDSQETISS